jgi:hypothetical protein
MNTPERHDAWIYVPHAACPSRSGVAPSDLSSYVPPSGLLSRQTNLEDSTEDSTARAFVTYPTDLSRITTRFPRGCRDSNPPGRNRTCGKFPPAIAGRPQDG